MKTMKLNPGDKVRITKDAWQRDCVTIDTTEGSIGTVLSYEEYTEVIGHRVSVESLAWVKDWIEAGTQYPIRIEIVMPLSEDCRAQLEKEGERFFVECKIGDIRVLSTDFLEKMIEG